MSAVILAKEMQIHCSVYTNVYVSVIIRLQLDVMHKGI